MVSTESQPLVSLCVPFYNQERYAAETVRSILSQTYPNFEMVACDDCSTDATADLVEDEIRTYRGKGGRADITFVRNDRNLGIVKNWENVFRLARGELLVSCGGDDISYPQRVERIVRAWREDGCRAAVIVHGFNRIDVDGNPSDSDMYSWHISAAHPLGAVTAYRRGIVDEFDPIGDDGGFEDQIFARRALLLGDEIRVDEPLIGYRIGSGDSTSEGNGYLQRLKTVRRCIHSYPQTYRDLERVRGRVDPARYERVLALADECARRYPAELAYLTAAGFLAKFRAYRAYRRVWGLPNHPASVADYISDYLHFRNRPEKALP